MFKAIRNILLVVFVLLPAFVFAGSIDTTNKYARVLSDSSLINFNPTNGSVTVTDSTLTGHAWGQNVGWINLAPTLGGITNTNGTLTGYAWGENTGWVNFNPTNGGVTIDCNGDFNGYAWSEAKGWLVFNCSTDSSCSTLDHKVSTDWQKTGCSSGGSSGGGGGGSIGNLPQPQCSDNRDNDLDGFVDRLDQACHLDGDVLNPNSYSPLINDENSIPKITLIGSADISVFVGTNYVDQGALAFDQEDGDLTSDIIFSGSVNTGAPDVFVLRYDVSDSHGRSAIPVLRTVRVNSVTENNNPPEITISGPTIITIHQDDNFINPVSSADDFEDGDLTNDIEIIGSVETENLGDYVVTYKVRDSGGLTDIKTVIVRVVPKNFPIPPVPIPEVTPPPIDFGGGLVLPPEISGIIQGTGSQIFRIIGLVGGLFLLLGSLLQSPISPSEIILLPFRFWTWFLSFLGLRKKYRPWGTVYDSVTKQPIDPAYVTLSDMNGNEIATSITDLDGRYGFLENAGTYALSAQKTNYIFPSVKMAGKQNDELYTDLYFGGPVELQEKEGIIAKNIPMDPLKFDWNEFAKKDNRAMRLYSRFDPMVARASDILFYAGFVVAIAAFYMAPAPYNSVIFGLYVVMLILRILGLKPKFNGVVINSQTGRPLSFAIIHVISPDLEMPGQRDIVRRVCDVLGRYYVLVPVGRYYVKIEEKNPDGTYSLVYTSPILTANRGIINKTFKI